MGQVLTADNIPDLVIASTTTITMAATYLGKPARVTIGGQQYKYSSLTTLNFATTGFNGLDTGSIASNTLYYIYAVQSLGTPGLVASLAAPTVGPTGFSRWKEIARCRTFFGSATLSSIVNKAGGTSQFSAGTDWESYLQTIGGTSTNGTVAYGTREAYWRRVRSALEVQLTTVMGAVSVAPTGFLTIGLPLSLSAINPVVGAAHNGTGVFIDDSLGAYHPFRCEISATKVYIVANSSTSIPTLAVNDQIKCCFTVPVYEWVGLYS